MELTEQEKRLIRMIENEKFRIDIIEKYWKKKPSEIKENDWSYTIMKIKEVNAFMEAIEGIIKILNDHKENKSNYA